MNLWTAGWLVWLAYFGVLEGAAVVRSIIVAAPVALYASADELFDFGAPQPTLSVRVAQLSATVGRGFAAKAIFHI